MTPDAATVIAYSAGLFLLVFLFFLFSSQGETRRAHRGWYGLPFLFAAMAAILLVRPAVLPGIWGLRLAAFCVLLAYGAGWQVARVLNSRRPLILAFLMPCTAWLGLAFMFVDDLHGWRQAVSGAARVLLVAAFNGLAAWEFRKGQEEQLPSAALLRRVFTLYAVLHLLRGLGSPWLPAPLGVADTKVWAVVLYNLAEVAQALLVSAFVIALQRERVGAENHRLAFQDAMTGVGNRRAFDVKMQGYAGSGDARRLALIIFDIDHFKSINDRFGHAFGDQVIIRAAEVARMVIRRPDRIFRIGGEEFACLVEDVTEDEAMAIGERLRSTFEAEARRVRAVAVAATISIGVATGPATDQAPAALLAKADKALYSAKGAGRNRVHGPYPG